MPVVELDYTWYPFSITISSLTSVAGLFSDETLRDYRGVFEESAAMNNEGIYVVIVVRYPIGQSSRMMGSMVFVKPGHPDTFNRDLGRMLDRSYTFQVQA